MRVFPSISLLLIASCLAAGTAGAEVCGDADGNGTVGVSDGVQALRAAAGLSSVCGTACDVNGDGDVTVTDGVSILRKAADLPASEACLPVAQIQELLHDTLPLFGSLTMAPSTSEDCDNADGSADVTDTAITFHKCDVNGFRFDGVIGAPDVTFETFVITDLTSGADVELNGTVVAQGQQDDVVLQGTLRLSSSAIGDLSLHLDGVVITQEGMTVAGHLVFDLSGSSIQTAISIDLQLEDSTTLPVSVGLNNQQTEFFTFDTQTGTLTSASPPSG